MSVSADMKIKLTNHQFYKSTEKNKKLWIKKGFSLIELLVVLAIMGFFIAMMAKVFTKGDDQRRFDETRIMMEEIKKAILGCEGAYAHGQRQFAGYVADMGELPGLVDVSGTPADPADDQPVGLWSKQSLPLWEFKPTSQTWMGWRGPYIETPPDDVMKDSWGNPFVFDDATIPGDLIIVSPGANGAIDATDTGFDEDITITIKQTEYMAPLAGRVKGFDVGTEANVVVTIYFPSGGIEPNPDHVITGVPSDGYFRFENGAVGFGTNGTTDIPVGLRSILVTGIVLGVSVQKQVIFTIEPTGNWLGDIELQ